MDFTQFSANHAFTRLHARVTEEDGGFTVSIRMLNHLNHHDKAWGQETAASIEVASEMIASLAAQFAIPQSCISISIMMEHFKDGTRH